jgi:hypothetical protein
MLGLLAVAAAGLFISPEHGRADLFTWWQQCKCPPPSYPVCHYWTPELYKVWACFCAPKISQYPAVRYPELPMVNQTYPYPCPPVVPTDYYSPYLLPIPQSSFPEKPKEKKETP